MPISDAVEFSGALVRLCRMMTGLPPDGVPLNAVTTAVTSATAPARFALPEPTMAFGQVACAAVSSVLMLAG